MAASTNIVNGAVVTFIVKVNGSTIPAELRVLSVFIEKKVNRISLTKITLLDGDASTGTFDVSSSAIFLPGAEVTIEAGYDSKNNLLFKGIITSQSLRIDEVTGSTLEVGCRDAAVKMNVGRRSLTFLQQKDSDIISSIIANYTGLSSAVAATTAVRASQVQYDVTDWDFILARAGANGMLVTTLNGNITVAKPDADITPVLSVKYGESLLAFNAELDAVSQLSSVKASSWDYKNQLISTGSASNDYAGPGNLSSKTLSGVIGLPDYQLQTTAPLETADLTDWSAAEMLKSEYAKIQGEAKFQGTNLADPGKYITLQGLGDRFTGDYLISGVVHNLSDGNWITEVSLGLSNVWFTESRDVMSRPAAGLLPGARGLFNGTVKKIFDDPEMQYRILVDVPLFDTNGAGIWARLSNFYSTSGAGAFFLPEVGDEVVLGFLNEDPRYPVILGSMYSNSQIKPYKDINPNEKNSLKGIVSKSGIYIQFDDENKVLTIETPNQNTFILSDKDQQIIIQDQNQNSITMSADGITIKSPKNINITADQNINLTGEQGIKGTAPGGDIQLTGINIKETADAQYSAEGGAAAQLISGMELTLKSAMIMIN